MFDELRPHRLVVEVPTLPLARVRGQSFFVFFKYLLPPTIPFASSLTRTRAAMSAEARGVLGRCGREARVPHGGTP